MAKKSSLLASDLFEKRQIHKTDGRLKNCVAFSYVFIVLFEPNLIIIYIFIH